jgi:hypothetical protein
MYGFDKLDPGQAEARGGTPYIEHMDWLLADDPAHFENYAIKDAQICALHVEAMLKFARDDLGLDVHRPPITLGSLAVKYLEKRWDLEGIKLGAVNGFDTVEQHTFNRNTGKGYLTKKGRKPRPRYSIYEELAKQCFHGGRNECFWYGPTSKMGPEVYAPAMYDWDGERWIGEILFRELDLASAYATALASLRIADYDKARTTTDPVDFRPDQLGFARVSFRFPRETTRFPCLPVIASDERGLVYPLAGEAFVTAPEIALARHMGAEVTVLDGVVIPWIEDSPRPFELVIRELSRRRKEHQPGSLQNEMFKQLGNSLYGKLGQGIKGSTSYNTRDDRQIEIGPSRITNPYLAAHVTGLIRALVSELIAFIPLRWTVISVTTDGFITNAPLCDLCIEGPVAGHLAEVRRSLTQTPLTQELYDTGRGLLEIKYQVPRLLPWRTRGVATLTDQWDFGCGPDATAGKEDPIKPKLARGGMREPAGTNDANAWFIRAALIREPGQKYKSHEPLPFPVAHRNSADHRFRDTQRAVNFEYDFKRQLVHPVPKFLAVPLLADDEDPRIVQHICCNTIPWQTVDDFHATRNLFEVWRHKHGGQLKTADDWRRWEEFQAGTGASRRGVRRSKDGVVGQALRIFCRAYARREWGLPGGSYKAAADALTTAGYSANEQTFKNAPRNKDPLPEQTIPANAPGICELIETLLSIWPEFEWQKLVAEPGPDYLRQTPEMPHSLALEIGGNAG